MENMEWEKSRKWSGISSRKSVVASTENAAVVTMRSIMALDTGNSDLPSAVTMRLSDLKRWKSRTTRKTRTGRSIRSVDCDRKKDATDSTEIVKSRMFHSFLYARGHQVVTRRQPAIVLHCTSTNRGGRS